MLQEIKDRQISDLTVLTMIWKVIEQMRLRNDNMTLQCLLNEQKLLHLSIISLEKSSISSKSELPYSLSSEIVNFIQKINQVTMQNFKEKQQDFDMNIFSKTVDLLMIPTISKYFENKKILNKLKVLTFNNLTCICKKKKKYAIALRSVSYALQIEENLMQQKTKQEKYDIIPTYLNKAAILSEMGRHEKAIEQIIKANKWIDRIETQVIKQFSQEQQSENNIKLEQKKHYGQYMKMIINYNMGVQQQHLKMTQSAKEYYKIGQKLAISINSSFMIYKFNYILNQLSKITSKTVSKFPSKLK